MKLAVFVTLFVAPTADGASAFGASAAFSVVPDGNTDRVIRRSMSDDFDYDQDQWFTTSTTDDNHYSYAGFYGSQRPNRASPTPPPGGKHYSYLWSYGSQRPDRASTESTKSLPSPPSGGKYVANDKVDTELEYPKHGSGLPECMLGLLYLDQLGLTLPLINDPTYPDALKEIVFGREFAEYTTSITTFDGQCITVGVGNRWLVGEATPSCGPDLQFCRSDSYGDPCAAGTVYISPQIDIFTSFGSAREYSLVRESWGWSRDSSDGGIFGATYPVVQIVGGDGQRTKYFDTFLKEANNEHACNPMDYQSFSCPQNQNPKGYSLVCTWSVR